jgi:hypothetical protein
MTTSDAVQASKGKPPMREIAEEKAILQKK